jgi:hypothetical protein
MQKAALYVSGIFFAIGTVAHLWRLINDIEIVINGIVVPMWISFPGVLVAALLAIWMLVAARRS